MISLMKVFIARVTLTVLPLTFVAVADADLVTNNNLDNNRIMTSTENAFTADDPVLVLGDDDLLKCGGDKKVDISLKKDFSVEIYDYKRNKSFQFVPLYSAQMLVTFNHSFIGDDGLISNTGEVQTARLAMPLLESDSEFNQNQDLSNSSGAKGAFVDFNIVYSPFIASKSSMTAYVLYAFDGYVSVEAIECSDPMDLIVVFDSWK